MAQKQGVSGNILEGLTDDSPSAEDVSTKLPTSPSVNTPTRTETAPDLPAPGERTA